jgi:hypothetical protein
MTTDIRGLLLIRIADDSLDSDPVIKTGIPNRINSFSRFILHAGISIGGPEQMSTGLDPVPRKTSMTVAGEGYLER